jgi:KDO2-lipid IV(A) lauroyltransferase
MTVPERVGLRLFRALGAVAHGALPGVRSTVAANQARVLGLDPETPLVRAATREAFALYARYWYDTFHIRALPSSEVQRRTRMEGVEHVARALEAGRGCICVMPHMGNWDVAANWMAINGFPIAAVAEVLKPLRLSELFVHHREELGMKVVPLREGTHVGQQLAGLLAANWLVALIADRNLTGRGIAVEMFGASRLVPAGPALISLSTGAPLLVCESYATPEGWIVRIGPPLEAERTGVVREDVASLTRLMASRFERSIAAKPTDWHMFQPAWS